MRLRGTRRWSPKLSNQVLAGVNYFHQTFNDFNTNFNLAAAGLNIYDGFNLAGAPNIQITGFDEIGLTPPEGREDITGHLTDVVSYTDRQAPVPLRRRIPPRAA